MWKDKCQLEILTNSTTAHLAPLTTVRGLRLHLTILGSSCFNSVEKSVSGGDPRFSGGYPILVWSLWLDFLLHFFISHTVQCWYCFHCTVFIIRIRLWMHTRDNSPSDWIVLVMTFWVYYTLCMCSNAWCAVADFSAALTIISYHHNMQVALLGEGVSPSYLYLFQKLLEFSCLLVFTFIIPAASLSIFTSSLSSLRCFTDSLFLHT